MATNHVRSFIQILLISFIAFGAGPAARAEDEPSGFTGLVKKREESKKKPKAKSKPKHKAESSHAAASEASFQSEKRAEPVAVAAATTSSAAPTASAAVEGPDTRNASGKDNKQELILTSGKNCMVMEFDSLPSEVISCTKPLAIQYTKRDCSSSKVIEIGETDAAVSCPDKKRIEVRFRSTQDALLAVLRVSRENAGRSGVVTRYHVERFTEEESSLSAMLSAPRLKSIDGQKPEEAPVRFKYSGFAWVEFERTRGFGYDAGTTTQTAQANFTTAVPQATQNNASFFTNINLELGKDRTSLVSILEIGEMYFGDTTSGGAQGGRANNIFEIRNLYLNHEFSDRLTAKGGLVTTSSDPRSFIFSDHVASIQAAYKTDLSEGLVWYGDASQNRPAATRLRDQYFGAQGTLGFLSGIKGTAFGLYRNKAGDTLANADSTTASGDSTYYWLGGTFDYAGFDPLSAQFTAIGNWIRTKLPSKEDNYSSYLLDTKLTYALAGPQLNFSLEGLMTPGAKSVTDSTSGKQLVGKRKNFVSPVASSYLLTVATSDGADDAPGTPKQSVIGNLNLDEGLRVLVFTTTANLGKNLTAFARYGYLNAAADSSLGYKHLGDEMDLGTVYQLTPTTTLQGDFGQFWPGKFYFNHTAAYLAAAKFKFVF